MKYEISKDREEILKTINESKNKNRNILWQNYDDNRTVLEIFNIQIDPIKEIIRFDVLDPSQVKKDLQTYIKLSHRNLIFKGTVMANNQLGVFVQIPDEIRLEELREHKRYSFKPGEDRTVLLAVDSSLTEIAKEHIAINLLDVSQSGLGIIVNYFDKEKVVNSKDVSLSSLGGFEFKSSFTMDAVYKSSIQVENQFGHLEDLFKIGFRFEENLPERLLADFVKSEENLFENEMGFLGKSRKFQKKLHREYREMLSKLENKKEFFEFFMGHGAIQNLGQEYLPKHIRLLSMFACALSKLCGICDRTVVSQLTYAAFVHDMAFFTNPKLAQIRNDQHFDKVKHLLNVYERELYFRSIYYAWEFSKNDPHSPSGSEFILKQLYEIQKSEDKDAFLKNGGISPLVAIFIVAHDLVDYILTHPNWTFYDYLERYPFDIYGDTFSTIKTLLNKARIAA